MSFGATTMQYLFQRKDLTEIRKFLRERNIDVNDCSIAADATSKKTCGSVMIHAIRNFDRAVMTCLLEEFGADLSLPCAIFHKHDPSKRRRLFPTFCALFAGNDAVNYVLEHGATPFVSDSEKFPYLTQRIDGQALLLLQYAKTRCRTAWVLIWTLSQLTGTLWPDMREPLAKMVVGMPLREFSRDSVKKRRVQEK